MFPSRCNPQASFWQQTALRLKYAAGNKRGLAKELPQIVSRQLCRDSSICTLVGQLHQSCDSENREISCSTPGMRNPSRNQLKAAAASCSWNASGRFCKLSCQEPCWDLGDWLQSKDPSKRQRGCILFISIPGPENGSSRWHSTNFCCGCHLSYSFGIFAHLLLAQAALRMFWSAKHCMRIFRLLKHQKAEPTGLAETVASKIVA